MQPGGPAIEPYNSPMTLSLPPAGAAHRIVVVGGGAGGVEFATKLGDKCGRKWLAEITLVDRSRTHLWEIGNRGQTPIFRRRSNGSSGPFARDRASAAASAPSAPYQDRNDKRGQE
jgi:hypothetical protein